jgi:diaminohydroxyphosphoribosylaminopyrimidine deaminase/5-amino-6-(5-phosphoribosylamino)uracil reductase
VAHAPASRQLEPPQHARIRLPRYTSSRRNVDLLHPVSDQAPADPFSWPQSGLSSDGWADVPSAFRAGSALPPPWAALFGPLQTGATDELMVIGQIGQSIDGRIATNGGRHEFINGSAGLAHLHRLRALVDAVVIGIGTALADDPLLTVRRVAGPNPARVVIDPGGRLPATARLLADNGVRRLVVTRTSARLDCRPGVERLALPAEDGCIEPGKILTALAEQGFRRLLIEGGADTLSRFLAAQCLDRLHVVVAPVILGSGRASCMLAAIATADHAIRPQVRSYTLGDEVLFDCDLSRQRRPLGYAKKSI